MERDWEELPLPALVAIFTRLGFEARLAAAFFVCPGWTRTAGDPRCWESMLPSLASPVESFIKVDDPTGEPPLHHIQAALGRAPPPPDDNIAAAESVKPEGEEAEFGYCPATSRVVTEGLARLRRLVKLSEGGIRSLCLSPFLTSEGGGPNDDQLLAFIAECCPNLKHLSLRGSLHASEAAMCEVIRRCKMLELLDFSYAPCFSVDVLRELGSCCPELRGIRRRGGIEYAEAAAIATNLPNVRLLNLAHTFLDYDGLSEIAYGCNGLEYFDITGAWSCDIDGLMGASWPIQEFSHTMRNMSQERMNLSLSC